MALLSTTRVKASGGASEGRLRHTVNVVLVLAVLLDVVGQALHLFGSGSGPLLVLVASFGVAAVVAGVVHLGRR